MLTVDDVQRIKVLNDQPDEHLAWLADRAEEMVLGEGERPFQPGDPATHMILIVEGAIQIVVREGGQQRVFGVFEAGDVTGMLPFSRMTHFGGIGTTLRPTRLAMVHKEHFSEMLHRMPALGQRLTAIMSDRVRESARGQQQREKMMALGKLAAGLAHELNNPAAAVRRDASALHERVGQEADHVAALIDHGVTAEQLQAVEALRATVAGRTPEPLSSLERADREDALADWLDEHDVAESWLLAETLAEAGVTADDLDHLARLVPDAAVGPVATWLEASLAKRRLLDGIEDAAARISDLVASVKTYSHMDRAPDKQPTDIHQGLDSTLTMLSHRIRKKAIRVERRYADDLPLVPAHPGELNQVWTNLIDNALDAMGEGGTLTLVTRREGVTVCIEVIDDGPGIPDDVQSRIFEPFFTTKDVGAGTGLGLDIVRRIVEQQHGGSVRLASEPGRTVFTVSLPQEAVPMRADGRAASPSG
ncbi:MAG: cyclic nucleotide-binding domain-containing protein [Bacteroidetes bacterium]|jgi:signal transduction histidine kinase|nr:cyclic nucleotide-binding domain-containing protein [Bacteroidota bacterium]